MAAPLFGAPVVARARASWSRRVPNDVSRRAQWRPRDAAQATSLAAATTRLARPRDAAPEIDARRRGPGDKEIRRCGAAAAAAARRRRAALMARATAARAPGLWAPRRRHGGSPVTGPGRGRRRGRRRATSSSRAYSARGRRARGGALGAAPAPRWLAGDGPGPWTTPRRAPGGTRASVFDRGCLGKT